MLVKDMSSLHVGVSGKVFVLPLGKSPDTSDTQYLADLCDSFVRKIGRLSTCTWFSVYASNEILDESPARIFELVYKIPYLTDADWGFQGNGASGLLRLDPAVVDVVNIDSSATGPQPSSSRKAVKPAPDEVLTVNFRYCA